MLSSLKNKINNIVSRARIEAIDYSKKLPRLKVSVLSGESLSNVEYFQQFGFASKPSAGAEAILIAVGGSRDHVVAIAVENRSKRFQDLDEGEVAIYHPEKNTYLKLKNNGLAELFGEKIALKNDSDDLVDLLSQALELLSLDTTNTALGPQPLTNASQYSMLKTKVDAFKE